MKYFAASQAPEPPLLADHPALDLLNAVVRIGGAPIDWSRTAMR